LKTQPKGTSADTTKSSSICNYRGARLDKYLVSFSKGTRQCAGINLAYAELYNCLRTIFRRHGGPEGEAGPDGRLELFETSKDDVEMVADMFIPFVKQGIKGIRVIVKNG